jgi:glycosyltransferase involved in cell wall biosynthesis
VGAVQPTDEFRVIAAGRFIEKKGFDTALRAFAKALRGRKDARLALIGGGPLETNLRRIAAEERIGGQVVWRTRLPFHEFMGEIAQARLGLYPSRTAADGDSEGGAPVTLIEAQWLGVPSLVSDHDDLPFVAAPEASHVLPPNDVSAWADHIAALYDAPARLEGMAQAARRFARDLHRPEKNLTAREQLYARVVRSPSATRDEAGEIAPKRAI